MANDATRKPRAIDPRAVVDEHAQLPGARPVVRADTRKNRPLCARCASRPTAFIIETEGCYPRLEICDECAHELRLDLEGPQ